MIQIPIEIGDIIRVGRFKNKRIKVKEIGVDSYGLPTVNGKGIMKIRIEKLIPEKEPKTENNMRKRTLSELLHTKDTEITIKQKDGKWWHCLKTVDGEEYLNKDGFDSKEQAEHSALTKGYTFPGIEKMKGKVPEIPKVTKHEPTKFDKPKEIDLGKGKELKLEILKIVKKVLREEIDKKKDYLTEADLTDKPELEAKARRYAELAQKMKELEAELKDMEKEYVQLDDEFRPLLEQVGKTKDTFIRAGKLLIKIERAGYEKTGSSYKTGFEYLYNKVNGTMKGLADEALKMTQTVSYVKSKISVVQGESVLKEESWFTKIKNFLSNKINKLFGLNKQANIELTKLERML